MRFADTLKRVEVDECWTVVVLHSACLAKTIAYPWTHTEFSTMVLKRSTILADVL
jgi:hypothetical protein